MYKHGKNITSFSLYPLSQDMKRLLLLMLEKIRDTVFIVHKTTMPTEYREKCIRRFKN